jgi:hypothetical protein
MFNVPAPDDGALFILVAVIVAVPPLKVILEGTIYGEFGFLEHKFDRFENAREFWAGLMTAVAWLAVEIWLLL